MRKSSLLLTLVLAFSCVCYAGDKAPDSEEAAVRVPLELYLKAHATGDPELIRQAFWDGAKVTAVREGKFIVMTRDEFAMRFSGKPANDESLRKRRIVMLDRAGEVAVAKIELDYPTVLFYDYMTLHKIDGQWKIVNKAFQATARTPAK